MLGYALTDFLAKRVVFVCQAALDRYCRLHAASRGKARVVVNGIDTALFAPDPERREQMRARLRAQGRFIWLTAGRLTPAKDLPNLLRAYAELASSESGSEPGSELWIAGEGSPLYRADLDRLVAGLGLAGRIRWLGLRRDLPALLDACDGFALGSAWEGMPLVVGEAMSMQKPVVATRVGGVAEIAGPWARLVSPSDPAALAAAMLSIERAPRELQVAMGTDARARILANFSLEASVGQWSALYGELLSESASEARAACV